MNQLEIISSIRELSKAYVPEWKLDSVHPDLGSAFALTFADMQADTLQKLADLPEKHHIGFLNAAGLPPLPQQAASGTICFSLANTAVEGCLVEADTPVMTEDNVVYTTSQPVYVTPASLQSVFYCLNDAIYKQSEGEFPLKLFNKQGDIQLHAFYLSHDWAFATEQGAELHLSAMGDNCHLIGDPTVVCWQYFSGEWTSFTDVRMDGDQLILAITVPTVRHEVQGQESYWLRMLAVSPSAEDIRLRSLNFGVSSRGSCGRRLYHEDVELTENGFYPFGKTLNLFADMHIACLEAFCKKDAVVEIRFTLESHRQEIQNPMPDMPVQWKRIMRKKELQPAPEYDVELTRIVIEYWNGLDFVLLPVVSDSLLSTTANPVQKSVSFHCPPDMAPSVMHGQESMWLRLRILEVSNLYKPNAHHVVPFLTNFEIHYHYPAPVLKGNFLACNNGQWNETEKPFDFTHHQECAIYLGFDRALGGSPVGFFWDVEPTRQSHELRWQIFSQGEWHPMQVIGNFFQSGVTTCYLETPMEACERFGETHFWLKVTLGSVPTVPLCINNLIAGAVTVRQKSQVQIHWETISVRDVDKLIPFDMNKLTNIYVLVDECEDADETRWVQNDSYTVTEQGIYFDALALGKVVHHKTTPVIQVRYRLTDGARGNCTANQICRMNYTIGYISGVTNPLPMQGGRDVETPEHFLKYAADKLMHRGRAVTAGGFESLALEAAGDLLACKCLSSMNDLGQAVSGGVTVVYLPEVVSGVYARNRKIHKYLSERCPPQLSIFVREVIYIEFSIHAEVLSKSDHVMRLREQLEWELTAFLHPVTGNFRKTGYIIGEVPEQQDILNFIQSFEEVQQIKRFSISAVEVDGLVRTDVDPAHLRYPAFVVPCSGQHRIQVEGLR